MQTITVEALKEILEAGEKINLVDVREPHEWEISNLSHLGSFLIPKGKVLGRIDELDKSAEIIVQCRSGSRSADVIRQLIPFGFNNLWNLDGGINRWAKEIDRTIPTY